jgi:hypothetical protein
MEQSIINILKAFKRATPRPEFLASSRQIILGKEQFSSSRFISSRMRFFETLRFSTALALGAVLLFVVLGGISYLRNDSGSLAHSNETILGEANSLNLQIQIKEAAYFSKTAEDVAVALDQIAETPTAPDVKY